MTHGTLVLTWLSSMHFHGAYFSNYSIWIKSPAVILPSSQSTWDPTGQDILNLDAGAYHQGIYITSGLYSIWRSSGLVHYIQIKLIAITLQMVSLLLLFTSYSHMKVIVYPNSSIFLKSRSIQLHHVVLLIGLASLCWSGHIVHISIPICRLLDSGVDSSMIPIASDLLSTNLVSSIYPTFGTSIYPEFTWSLSQEIMDSLWRMTVGVL